MGSSSSSKNKQSDTPPAASAAPSAPKRRHAAPEATELPDFWRRLPRAVVGRVVRHAARADLRRLARCRVNRLAEACALEASARDQVTRELAAHVRAFAGLVGRGSATALTAAPLSERVLQHAGARLRVSPQSDAVAMFVTIVNALSRAPLPGALGGTILARDTAVALVGYAYWRAVAVSTLGNGGRDDAPVAFDVHHKAHIAAMGVAQTLAGGDWGTFVLLTSRDRLDGHSNSNSARAAGAEKEGPAPQPRREWAPDDTRPFLEHRRIQCSRKLTAELRRASDAWAALGAPTGPAAVLEAMSNPTSTPWFGVGCVVCEDIWLALYFHFDALRYSLGGDESTFTETTVLWFRERLEASALSGAADRDAGASAAPAAAAAAPAAAAAAAAVPPPPMSPRSCGRLKQLVTLQDQVDAMGSATSATEAFFRAELLAPASVAEFGSRFVAERDRVAEARLASVVDELAQQYGNLEKLLFTKVDAIITADLDSGRIDAKAKRKALTKAVSALMERVVGMRKEVDAARKQQLR